MGDGSNVLKVQMSVDGESWRPLGSMQGDILTLGGFTRSDKEKYTPKHIIYQGKKTIVLWKDGTKTIVQCGDGEEFNKESGFMFALTRKIFDNRSGFLKMIKENSSDQKFFTKEERKEKKRLKRKRREDKEGTLKVVLE